MSILQGLTARIAGRDEQCVFVHESGISQQMLSEWERGLRNRVTTEMLHVAAKPTSTPLVTISD